MLNFTNNTNYFKLITLVSFLSLGFAYYLEIVHSVIPCTLCLWQRGVYFIIMMISILTLIRKVNQKIASYGIFICLLSGLGISILHTGIERKIIDVPGLCTTAIDVNNLKVEDIENLENVLPESRPGCDKVNYRILGLSLAELNILFMGAWIVLHCNILRRIRKK